MPLFFQVDDRTFSYSIEAIPKREIIALDRVSLLKAIIRLSNKIKEYYEAAVSKFGKLFGQGRIGLLELLDQQCIELILLVEKFKLAFPDVYQEFQNDNKFLMLLENKANKYTSSGIIKQEDIRLSGEFGKTYMDLVMSRLKKVLMLQKQVGEGDEQAVTGLFETLDELLYWFIILRYNVIKCTIDR